MENLYYKNKRPPTFALARPLYPSYFYYKKKVYGGSLKGKAKAQQVGKGRA